MKNILFKNKVPNHSNCIYFKFTCYFFIVYCLMLIHTLVHNKPKMSHEILRFKSNSVLLFTATLKVEKILNQITR